MDTSQRWTRHSIQHDSRWIETITIVKNFVNGKECHYAYEPLRQVSHKNDVRQMLPTVENYEWKPAKAHEMT